jgi:short-subunit dehydrogenase
MLETLVQEIHASGGKASYEVLDITDRDAVLAGIKSLEAKHGPTDLLIANAGIGKPVRMRTFDSRKVEEIMQVNVLGAMHAIDGVLPGMFASGKGHIVGISSLSAYISVQRLHAYASSKACLSHFLRGARIELLKYNIDVSTICPGYVRTPMMGDQKGLMFILETEQACAMIEKAILARKKVYNFPWYAYLVFRTMALLPDKWLRRVSAGKSI